MVEYWFPKPKVMGSIPFSPVFLDLKGKVYIYFNKYFFAN